MGFLHDMLVTAGGADAFGDVKREGVPVSTEMLLARAPEVLLELRPSEGWDAARLARERRLAAAAASPPFDRPGLHPGRRPLPARVHASQIARAFADVLHPGR